jgi:hypothetical protein
MVVAYAPGIRQFAAHPAAGYTPWDLLKDFPRSHVTVDRDLNGKPLPDNCNINDVDWNVHGVKLKEEYKTQPIKNMTGARKAKYGRTPTILAAIEGQLKAGIPVIAHVSSSGHPQHFVVIIGVTKDETDFIINDPAQLAPPKGPGAATRMFKDSINKYTIHGFHFVTYPGR